MKFNDGLELETEGKERSQKIPMIFMQFCITLYTTGGQLFLKQDKILQLFFD